MGIATAGHSNVGYAGSNVGTHTIARYRTGFTCRCGGDFHIPIRAIILGREGEGWSANRNVDGIAAIISEGNRSCMTRNCTAYGERVGRASHADISDVWWANISRAIANRAGLTYRLAGDGDSISTATGQNLWEIKWTISIQCDGIGSIISQCDRAS